MQEYSNPRRASDSHSLPDLEVWRDRVTEVTCCDCGTYSVPYDEAHAISETYCPSCGKAAESVEDTERRAWFWRACFPGYLPDSDTYGPFESREAALADAREGVDDDDDLDDDSDDEGSLDDNDDEQ